MEIQTRQVRLRGGAAITSFAKSAEQTPAEPTPQTTSTILVGTDQTAPSGYQTVSAVLKDSNIQTPISIQLTTDITDNITIPQGKTVTIDLNGHTITNDNSISSNYVQIGHMSRQPAGAGSTIVNNGILTIEDSIGGGTIDTITDNMAAVFNNYNAACTLSGGTYTRSQEDGTPDSVGGNSWYTIYNRGKMTINPGVTVKTISSSGTELTSLIENESDDDEQYLQINGGYFEGGVDTIKNDGGGNLTITDGTFINHSAAVLVNYHKATIKGGTFTLDPSAAVASVIMNAQMRKGASDKNGWWFGRGKLEISGGTFTSGKDYAPVIQMMNIETIGNGIETGSGADQYAEHGNTLGDISISGDAVLNGNINLAGVHSNTVEDETIPEGDLTGDTLIIESSAKVNGSVLVPNDVKDIVLNPSENPNGTTFSWNGPSIQTGFKYVYNYEDLVATLASAQENDVIYLANNIVCEDPIVITKSNITIDGQGKYELSYTGTLEEDGKPENGAFITVQTPAEGVTLKNLTVKASGIKHGIQYYCTEGGSIEGVTINGADATSIEANGCQNLTIKDCTLNPNDSAWANIEFGIGDGVNKIPSITVSGLKVQNEMPYAYLDSKTIGYIKNILQDTTMSNQDVVDYLTTKQDDQSAPSLNFTDADVKVENGSIVVIPHVEDTKPSTPSTGGSSSTQKPLEGISLGMTSAQVGPGDTLQMNVTYTPSDTTASKRVTWTSSDEDVVTVDRNGKVTATGKSGKATITATVGGKTATCTITINPFKVDVEDLNGAVTSCKADGSTVIKVPQSMSYNFDISSGVTLDSFDYTVGNDKVGGTNTITRWNGTSGKYQIYAAGAVGSQTGVYVNGVKLFTIEVTERPFTSDTTLDMSLKVGTPYMFRITPDDKNASFTFLTADGKALSTSYKAELYPDEKGDYYCTVTPLQANRDIGVYCVIGGNTYKVFTVHTIA